MNADNTHHWDTHYDNGQDFRMITNKALSDVLDYVDVTLPKTHLDIGCGTGQLTRELHHRGYACLGIDLSAVAIDTAKSSTTHTDTLDYLAADFEQLDTASLPLRSYSLITCKLVFAFIKDKESFLKKVHALLEPGGTFVIMSPINHDNEKSKIAIDYNQTLQQLQSIHSDVITFGEFDITYFICTK